MSLIFPLELLSILLIVIITFVAYKTNRKKRLGLGLKYFFLLQIALLIITGIIVIKFFDGDGKGRLSGALGFGIVIATVTSLIASLIISHKIARKWSDNPEQRD